MTVEESGSPLSVSEPVPPVPPAPLAPTSTSERILAIDILRGLALFGILAANIRGFAGPAVAYFQPHLFWPSFADRLGQAFIDTFIQGKFITIFAFLFGVGFTVQLTRAAARGSKFGWLYSKRLLVLLGFGLIHGLLIWFGDILLPYALIGFLLFFFRNRKDRTIAVWATILYLVPLLLMTAISVVISLTEKPIPMPPPPTTASLQREAAIFADGTWGQIQAQRMKDVVSHNWGYLPFFGTQVLALFLLGVIAWRRGLLTPAPEQLPRYRQVMMWALPLGVLLNASAVAIRWIFDVPMMPPTPMLAVIMAIQTIGTPMLSLGYVTAVIVLCHSERWRKLLARFGAIGQTALSNYLLQSIIGTLLFYSYGLGLFGTMGPALLLIPTVVIYALQAMVAPWWVSRFQFGPAEWLWRSLTYGKLQPFVRPPQSVGGAVTTPAA